MKVTTDKSEFKPVTLNIKFETKEEFDIFYQMTCWNSSIPELMFNTASAQIKVKNMLDNLRKALLDYKSTEVTNEI